MSDSIKHIGNISFFRLLILVITAVFSSFQAAAQTTEQYPAAAAAAIDVDSISRAAINTSVPISSLTATTTSVPDTIINHQHLVPVDSPVYEYIRVLCADQMQLPAIAEKPVSSARILEILDGIDYRRLSASAQHIYDAVQQELSADPIYDSLHDSKYRSGETGKDGNTDSGTVSGANSGTDSGTNSGTNSERGFAFDASVEVNFETYWEQDDQHIMWFMPEEDRLPFVSIPLEGWFGESAYSKIVLPIKKEPFLYEYLYGLGVDHPELEVEHPNIWHNIPLYFSQNSEDDSKKTLNVSQIDIQFPYTAYIAAGGKHWDLQVGRGVLEYGSGRSGNFLISNHIPYYSMLRTSTRWRQFSFFYSAMDLEPFKTDALNMKETNMLQRMLIDHGFMLTPHPRLRIILKESALMTNFYPTINYLNPLMIFHNWYWEYSNIMMTLDVEFLLAEGLTVYGALALDQYQTAFEKSHYTQPSAYGYMAGLEFSRPSGSGYWIANAEWVYTNPWLYIHKDSDKTSNASFMWLGHIEEIAVEGGSYFKKLPLGYPAGPDSINLITSLGYRNPGNFSVSGGYTLSINGEQDIETEYQWVDEVEIITRPAEISHTVLIEGDWNPPQLGPFHEIGASAAYIWMKNEDNQPGSDYQDQDFQFSVHASFAF